MSKPGGSGFAVHWSALIAQRAGLYAAEGLEVEIVQLDQDAGTAALLSGEVPIMRRGPDETIAQIAAGAPLRLLAGLVRTPPIDLYVTPDVTSIAALRGRTIAGISARFGSSLALRLLLEDEGLMPADVHIVHAGGSIERLLAMREGRASAAVLSPPADRHARDAGFVARASFPQRYPRLLFSAIQGQTAYVDAHPDIVTRLLMADVRAQRRLCDPRYKDESIAFLAEADGIRIEEATACYETMVERDRVFLPDADIGPADLQLLLETMIRFGEVPMTLASDHVVDDRFLREAQRRIGPRA